MSGVNIPVFSPPRLPKNRSFQKLDGVTHGVDKEDFDHQSSEKIKVRNTQSILSIGKGVILSGKIVEADQVIIHGSVEAEVSANSVEVMSEGSLKGSINPRVLSVSGICKGEAEVSGTLTVQNGGCFEGDVTYDEISVERGGMLSGTLSKYTAGAPMEPLEQIQTLLTNNEDTA